MDTDVRSAQLIGANWVTGDAAAIAVVDPATEQAIAEIPSASAEQVADAIGAARDAFGGWRRRSMRERGVLVREMARVVADHADRLAQLLTSEVGKPAAQAQMEVAITAAYLEYVAEWDRRIEGDIIQPDAAGEIINLVRAPLGVVAAICPWNAPLAVFARKVGPALLTGNTVVVKPSEESPLATLELVRLLVERCDLPEGVLNVVTGAGEVGRALVVHPDVAMVTMTGHRDTGKRIMADAAQNLTRVSLELGGKAPLIVWKDADVDAAAEAGVLARHANSGQICNCAERVFVHRDVADAFTARYVEIASSLRVGDPTGDVDMGPLVSAGQLDKALAAIDVAQRDGASVALAGGRRDGDQPGYYCTPTVLTDVTPSMAIMREETFAPVTPIMVIDDFDEALRLSNDSRYGLSAYLFTNDYRLAMRASDELDVGELFVNRSIGESLQGHHIGHKESGLGGEDGKYGILKYTQVRSVYHRYA